MRIGVLIQVGGIDALAQLDVAALRTAHERLIEVREVSPLSRVNENARQRQLRQRQDLLDRRVPQAEQDPRWVVQFFWGGVC